MRQLICAVLLVTLTGCSRSGGSQAGADERFQRVNTTQGAQLAQSPGILILDVRTPREYAAGHLPGAVLVPVTEMPSRLDELPQDLNTPLLVYCGSGPRARAAATMITARGYAKVHELEGGITAWQGEGRPVVR